MIISFFHLSVIVLVKVVVAGDKPALFFFQPDIEAAIASTKKTINIAHANRKKQSVIQTIKLISQKPDYASNTDGKKWVQK